MSKKFTDAEALKVLKQNGAEIKNKLIVVKNGLNGLSACSALDYLCHYQGYKVLFSKN